MGMPGVGLLDGDDVEPSRRHRLVHQTPFTRRSTRASTSSQIIPAFITHLL